MPRCDARGGEILQRLLDALVGEAERAPVVAEARWAAPDSCQRLARPPPGSCGCCA